ncbi:MAG: alpha/beta hydrolase [Candidatus Binatia bacterium]
MRTLSTALALFIVLTLPAEGAFVCAPPSCVDVEVPVPNPPPPGFASVPDRGVRIFLPEGYSTDGPGYPVLYLLHGAGDTSKTWSENTDVFAFTRDQRVIVVMPDGGRNSEAGWYSDWLDGSRQWETFHLYVLIPYVESTYNALGAGHRAVAGLSMGGFGAMHASARHPGMFAAAASFSGAVDINYGFPVSGVAYTLLHDMFGTPTDRVWGNQITNQNNWRAHNPADLAPNLAGTNLFLTTGQGLPIGTHDSPADLTNPNLAGGYAVEQFIWQLNVSFVARLELAQVPRTDWFYPGGSHSWSYWQDSLHWALPQILEVIE